MPQTLMDELVPEILARVEASKESLIADCDSLPTRLALRAAWPHLMHVLPDALRIGYRSILDKFAHEDLATLVSRLASDLHAA